MRALVKNIFLHNILWIKSTFFMGFCKNSWHLQKIAITKKYIGFLSLTSLVYSEAEALIICFGLHSSSFSLSVFDSLSLPHSISPSLCLFSSFLTLSLSLSPLLQLSIYLSITSSLPSWYIYIYIYIYIFFLDFLSLSLSLSFLTLYF